MSTCANVVASRPRTQKSLDRTEAAPVTSEPVLLGTFNLSQTD
jgi:hypothetical protein